MVRKRMGNVGVTSAQQDEIVAELASHLEDLYEKQLEGGSGEHEAVARVLGELTEGRRLARNIRRATHEEDEMNDRTRRFWLPGFVSLTAANLLLMLLQRTVFPLSVFRAGSVVMAQYVPLLVAAPLFGATGAYLSHRAGGGRLACLGAGLFPLTAMVGTICVLALTGNFRLAAPLPFHFAIALLFGVMLPGAALLLGVLPFLKASKPMIPTRN
ncbi:MAG TPA: hypothetical protein VJW51_01485 [Candidatus Acidoferrales bacterium]|nr:hypothetical protein [Candidatus Acidoferrales bacterium]